MGFKISSGGRAKVWVKDLAGSEEHLERRLLPKFPIPQDETSVEPYYYIWYYFVKGVQAEIDRLTKKAMNEPKEIGLDVKLAKANDWKRRLVASVKEGKVFWTSIRFLEPTKATPAIKMPSQERLQEISIQLGLDPQDALALLQKLMGKKEA